MIKALPAARHADLTADETACVYCRRQLPIGQDAGTRVAARIVVVCDGCGRYATLPFTRQPADKMRLA